jgi:hypothetical protein
MCVQCHTASVTDYELLEKLNTLATEKYQTSADRAAGLVAFIEHMNSKCMSYSSSCLSYILCIHLCLCSSPPPPPPTGLLPPSLSFFISTDSAIQPHLDQVDELEANVLKLQEVVNRLDVYTKQLGTLAFIMYINLCSLLLYTLSPHPCYCYSVCLLNHPTASKFKSHLSQ